MLGFFVQYHTDKNRLSSALTGIPHYLPPNDRRIYSLAALNHSGLFLIILDLHPLVPQATLSIGGTLRYITPTLNVIELLDHLTVSSMVNKYMVDGRGYTEYFEDIGGEDILVENISRAGYTNTEPVPNELKPGREEIDIAKKWIKNVLLPFDRDIQSRTLFYTSSSSYGMKHWVENKLQFNPSSAEEYHGHNYMSNGAFIVAMIELGYRARARGNSGPHVYFNVRPAGYFYALGQDFVYSANGGTNEKYTFNYISNYNLLPDRCSGETCSAKATEYLTIHAGNKNSIEYNIHIPFCFKHASFHMGLNNAKKKLTYRT